MGEKVFNDTWEKEIRLFSRAGHGKKYTSGNSHGAT